MKVTMVNLGCCKNLYDSERIAGLLQQNNIRIVKNEASADCLLINTCAFIEDARREALETMEKGVEWRDEIPGRRLFVIGCFPQLDKLELEQRFPQVDGFFGVGDYEKVVRMVKGEQIKELIPKPRYSFTPKHYRYLRIADGCDRTCSYCAIPFIRGPYQSLPMKELIREAEVLTEEGAKELIIIAQEINSYGSDLRNGSNLYRLLRELVKIEGISWIRLLYLHPPLVEEELLKLMAEEEKLCTYIDFPIEHINDHILRRMGRRINRRRIVENLELAKRLMPDCALRTSIMVGFPGEGDEEFAELADFVSEGWFDKLGVFIYSPEAGTKAANYPAQIPLETAEFRQETIMEIQREISQNKNEAKVGRELSVLIDEKLKEGYFGRTVYDAPEVDGGVIIRGKAKVGDMVKVKITEADEYDLRGIVIA